MAKKDFPFTEEQIQKHIRFLTKEDIETSIKDLRVQSNLYHQKDLLFNTDELDKKFREYLTEGNQLIEIVISRDEIFFKLRQLIAAAKKKYRRYARQKEPAVNDPDCDFNKDMFGVKLFGENCPEVFFITDEMLNIDCKQLKYLDDFMGTSRDSSTQAPSMTLLTQHFSTKHSDPRSSQ